MVNLSGALKGKIFGMPRWLFFTLLIAGVAIGIYLRRRNIQNADTADQNQPSAEDYGGDSGEPFGQLPDGEPGLAGVGVASPPGGVYPVTTPMIPEGLTDIIGDLSGVISDIATNPPNAVEVSPDIPAPPTSPNTGGGAPIARPHTPPKRAIRVPRGARLSKTPGGRTRITVGHGKAKRTIFAPKGTPVKRKKRR